MLNRRYNVAAYTRDPVRERADAMLSEPITDAEWTPEARAMWAAYFRCEGRGVCQAPPRRRGKLSQGLAAASQAPHIQGPIADDFEL